MILKRSICNLKDSSLVSGLTLQNIMLYDVLTKSGEVIWKARRPHMKEIKVDGSNQHRLSPRRRMFMSWVEPKVSVGFFLTCQMLVTLHDVTLHGITLCDASWRDATLCKVTLRVYSHKISADLDFACLSTKCAKLTLEGCLQPFLLGAGSGKVLVFVHVKMVYFEASFWSGVANLSSVLRIFWLTYYYWNLCKHLPHYCWYGSLNLV